MSVTIVEIFDKLPTITIELKPCDHPLLNGKCVHIHKAPGIEYDHLDCGRGSGTLHRHSHTWQPGDARYQIIDGKLLNMESGEVLGQVDYYNVPLHDYPLLDELRPWPTDEGRQEQARLTLLNQYGMDIREDIPMHKFTPPSSGYKWYYNGQTTAIGTDTLGHDVEFHFDTGQLSRIYSQNQRTNAVRVARNQGAAVAGRKYDIPAETVRSWAKRSN